MVYTVWLCTRPLSYAMHYPQFEFTSHGRDFLRHWGVLVSELSLVDFQVIIQRKKNYQENNNISLGIMYELFRNADQNNLRINRPFTMSRLRLEWRAFSSQYVGVTELTHEIIEHRAISIINKYPNYRVFENNCQNFVKYLLEEICPNSLTPDTIQDMLERMREVFRLHQDRESAVLPGEYPLSIISADNSTFMTANGTIWVTASGDTWVTAFESRSLNDRNLSIDGRSMIEPNTDTGINFGIELNPLLASFRRILMKVDLANVLRTQDVELLRSLLSCNINIDPRDTDGETALQVATSLCPKYLLRFILYQTLSEKEINVDIINALISAGCDVSTTESNGSTPLHIAVKHPSCYPAVLKALLDGGAAVSARDNLARTALHLAINGKNSQLIRVLLDASPDLSARDVFGYTPLQLAVRKSYRAAIEMLLDAGANVSVDIENEDSILHLAASKGNMAIVKLLLNAGADVLCRDKTGKTPLDRTEHSKASPTLGGARKMLLNAELDALARLTSAESPSRRHFESERFNSEALKLFENIGISSRVLHKKGSMMLRTIAQQHPMSEPTIFSFLQDFKLNTVQPDAVTDT